MSLCGTRPKARCSTKTPKVSAVNGRTSEVQAPTRRYPVNSMKSGRNMSRVGITTATRAFLKSRPPFPKLHRENVQVVGIMASVRRMRMSVAMT